jgi:hypothetical protein
MPVKWSLSTLVDALDRDNSMVEGHVSCTSDHTEEDKLTTSLQESSSDKAEVTNILYVNNKDHSVGITAGSVSDVSELSLNN